MTEEQKELKRLAESSVSAVRAWQSCIPQDADLYKMLDTCAKTFEKMIAEWTFAIGNPQKISGETIKEIVDRVVPIVADVIKYRIDEKKL